MMRKISEVSLESDSDLVCKGVKCQIYHIALQCMVFCIISHPASCMLPLLQKHFFVNKTNLTYYSACVEVVACEIILRQKSSFSPP